MNFPYWYFKIQLGKLEKNQARTFAICCLTLAMFSFHLCPKLKGKHFRCVSYIVQEFLRGFTLGTLEAFFTVSHQWPGIYFEIHRAPSQIPANLPGQFSSTGQTFLHWAPATLKGLGEFQNKKFQATLHHHFKPKMSISRLKILVHL